MFNLTCLTEKKENYFGLCQASEPLYLLKCVPCVHTFIVVWPIYNASFKITFPQLMEPFFIRFQASTDADEKTDVFSRVSCSIVGNLFFFL